MPDRMHLDRPAALIDGTEVSWDGLLPMLSEIAGESALAEVVLDRAVARAFENAGLVLTQELVDQERSLVLGSLVASGNESVSLDELRISRGLGPVRFDRVLRRTAMLRMLVQPMVVVTDDLIKDRFDIVHGETVTFRVMTVRDRAIVEKIWHDMAARTGTLGRLEFAAQAVIHSTDVTAQQGGLMLRVSPSDPAYPEVIRNAIATTTPGTISQVLALGDGQYALVWVEETYPPDGVQFEAVRNELKRELVLRQERVHMDAMVRQLTAGVVVQPLDPSLAWSWNGVHDR